MLEHSQRGGAEVAERNAERVPNPWHEVATIERLFPILPGMEQYKQTLRGITKNNNELLLKVVEDLSYKFSDNIPISWNPEVVEEARERFLEDCCANAMRLFLQTNGY